LYGNLIVASVDPPDVANAPPESEWPNNVRQRVEHAYPWRAGAPSKMAAMRDDDDPGWPKDWRVLVAVLPGGMQYYMRKREESDGLVTLRTLTLAFSSSIVLFAVVLAFIAPQSGELMPWLALLVAGLAVSMIAVRVTEKPLPCDSPTALAFAYRTRFFLRLAFAESVALLGFVFAFIGAGAWAYYVAAALALFRIWTSAAPTRRSLERDQERLRDDGCRLRLVAALRNPTSS
jgi:F0F1-type ATP synthase membrane subunit c/vacuolar-type H+-ATPase subunit K